MEGLRLLGLRQAGQGGQNGWDTTVMHGDLHGVAQVLKLNVHVWQWRQVLLNAHHERQEALLERQQLLCNQTTQWAQRQRATACTSERTGV